MFRLFRFFSQRLKIPPQAGSEQVLTLPENVLYDARQVRMQSYESRLSSFGSFILNGAIPLSHIQMRFRLYEKRVL